MTTMEVHDLSWLTPAVRALPPYRGPQTAADAGARGMRLLHLNESPYPPSPCAAAAMARGEGG